MTGLFLTVSVFESNFSIFFKKSLNLESNFTVQRIEWNFFLFDNAAAKLDTALTVCRSALTVEGVELHFFTKNACKTKKWIYVRFSLLIYLSFHFSKHYLSSMKSLLDSQAIERNMRQGKQKNMSESDRKRRQNNW